MSSLGSTTNKQPFDVQHIDHTRDDSRGQRTWLITFVVYYIVILTMTCANGSFTQVILTMTCANGSFTPENMVTMVGWHSLSSMYTQ